MGASGGVKGERGGGVGLARGREGKGREGKGREGKGREGKGERDKSKGKGGDEVSRWRVI